MRRNAAEDIMILSLPGCWIKGDYFEISHLWLQNLSYHNPSLKSIHKKPQIFFCNSTSITASPALLDYKIYNRHIPSLWIFGPGTYSLEASESRLIVMAMIISLIHLSINMTLVDPGSSCTFFSSDTDSRAWGMISFWVEKPFWVSSYPAHELHQLPRRKMGHGRTRTKHGRLAAKNAKTREVGVIHHSSFYIKCSPFYYSPITPRFFDKLSQVQSSGLNHITSNEKSPEPAQGMSHTASLAPKGFFWLFSSLFAYKINQGET